MCPTPILSSFAEATVMLQILQVPKEGINPFVKGKAIVTRAHLDMKTIVETQQVEPVRAPSTRRNDIIR